MGFIELTLVSTNVTVWLNVAHIAGFYYDAAGEQTVVTVHGERDEVNVKETPGEVLTLIDRAARGAAELEVVSGRREQLPRAY